MSPPVTGIRRVPFVVFFAIAALRAAAQESEVFNVTNRTNVVSMNGNFGAGAYPAHPSPTFGQVTAVGEPRALQLGARVSF